MLTGIYKEDGVWKTVKQSNISLAQYPLWAPMEPNMDAGDCVSGHTENLFKVEDCEKVKLPFYCKQTACLQGG